MARYSNTHKPREAKLINVIGIPAALDVVAVYAEENGTEIKFPVFLIGIFDNGDCGFLETSEDGGFDRPEQAQNFLRFEYRKR